MDDPRNFQGRKPNKIRPEWELKPRPSAYKAGALPSKLTRPITIFFPQILCSFCYLGPSYLMTSQPLELFRFCYFILLGTMSSLVAQSTGFLFGATLPVTVSPVH